MRILITGATGLIGRQLTALLLDHNHHVTILTRDPDRAKIILGQQVHYLAFLDQLSNLNEFDAIINLAGEPIADKRWTAVQKQKLCQSRWQLTRQLSQLCKVSSTPPAVMISGSAVGYYGAQDATPLTEQSPAHDEFTYQLCRQWEAYAQDAASEQTRVCLLRTGIVLSTQGGALTKMLLPFRLGIGGVIGHGQQYLSWIHIQDMVAGIYYLLTHSDACGPFNMTAPYPVTNHCFSHTLARMLHRPCIMPIPAFAIRLLMGEVATLVVDGQRALPQHLQQIGFQHQFSEIKPALSNLLSNRH